MGSAFADPFSPRRLAAAPERHVAVVVLDGDPARVAGALRRWAGRVTVHDLAELEGERPDAVVLVADLVTRPGMAALRRIRAKHPSAPLVVVAHDGCGAGAARQTLNAGADAFVPAGEADAALAPALDAVLAGLVCAPRAARRLIAKPTFSHREKQVLELLITGLTNREIGARLYLAESTVKTHLASAFAKLGVHSRKDAVAVLLDPAEALERTALPSRKPSRPGAVDLACEDASATTERWR
jgi:DNA-binding NarL/FixJ family response regulator